MRAAALFLLLGAGCTAAVPPRWTSSPLPEPDGRFLREASPWRGGDAAYSVALSADRVLWFFGDTFIAPPGSAARAGSRMIRNTLATQAPGSDLEYFWRTERGQPADALPAAAGPGWLWPLSGLRIGPSLHVFMMQMTARGEGAFGFAFSKSVLLTVENPDDAPASWKIRQQDIPHAVRNARSNLFFGSASVLHDGRLYIYGVHEGPKGRGLILARVDAAAIADFSRWTFFNGDGWSAELMRAKELHMGASVEMSVSRFQDGFVSVYTKDGMSPEILIRRAPKPEGPWSEPIVAYRCPETGWNKNYFCYAAKAHPELAKGPDELIVTYACNSTNFTDVFGDLRIYRPRFVRIALE